MTVNQRIKAFENLGLLIGQFIQLSMKDETILQPELYNRQKELIRISALHNGWFTEENVIHALSSIAVCLTAENLTKWISSYNLNTKSESPKKVAVIMAGNIPLVGFQDMACVLMSGHHFIGKLSSKDDKLLPFIAEALCMIEPEFKPYIQFTNAQLNDFDAVIATGSNNASIYFNYYFSKYPHIIRKNRNSVAILNGNETRDELVLLGRDVFQYFGLGCRNVSKLFVPQNYSFNLFFNAIEHYNYLINHNKYMNNYSYYKSLLLLNKAVFLDNGFLIVKEDISMYSPVANIYYEYYVDFDDLNQRIRQISDGIQCIIASKEVNGRAMAFGSSQKPMLWDYADGVDTMKFLIHL
jgi:hypothetical protein